MVGKYLAAPGLFVRDLIDVGSLDERARAAQIGVEVVTIQMRAIRRGGGEGQRGHALILPGRPIRPDPDTTRPQEALVGL